MGRPRKAAEQKLEEALVVIGNLPSTRTRASNIASKTETTQEVKKTEDTSPVSKQDVVDDLDVSSSAKDNEEQLIKRKRGRPANKDTSDKKKQKVIDPSIPKRGRGRPKKVIPV